MTSQPNPVAAGNPRASVCNCRVSGKLNLSSIFTPAATALALFMGAGGLSAGEYASRIEAIGGGGDSIQITAKGPHYAIVTYRNSPEQNSYPTTVNISHGGMTVAAKIEIGTNENGDECVTISPEEPLIAMPETDCTHDGGEVSIIVALPPA